VLLADAMSIHIIIDGYNRIRQSKTLRNLDQRDLQLGRERLVDMLAAYKKFKHHRITVVFDGSQTRLSYSQQDRLKGIFILFSPKGESADTLIKRMAHNEREHALVVSSDQEIVHAATSHGATTMSSAEFETKLLLALESDMRRPARDKEEGWNPTTKKKGPSRRPSKRKRRDRVIIAKL
jgi:uncharacterized protein